MLSTKVILVKWCKKLWSNWDLIKQLETLILNQNCSYSLKDYVVIQFEKFQNIDAKFYGLDIDGFVCNDW